jgi:adenine deaminase
VARAFIGQLRHRPAVARADEPADLVLTGRVLPGFIDGHIHIESTKLMVGRFAGAVLPWGTTTVVLGPHEIANVFGLPGDRVAGSGKQRFARCVRDGPVVRSC